MIIHVHGMVTMLLYQHCNIPGKGRSGGILSELVHTELWNVESANIPPMHKKVKDHY